MTGSNLCCPHSAKKMHWKTSLFVPSEKGVFMGRRDNLQAGYRSKDLILVFNKSIVDNISDERHQSYQIRMVESCVGCIGRDSKCYDGLIQSWWWRTLSTGDWWSVSPDISHDCRDRTGQNITSSREVGTQSILVLFLNPKLLDF